MNIEVNLTQFSTRKIDLRTEFLRIINESNWIFLDRMSVEEINCKLRDLFNNFNLGDLQWNCTVNNGSIMFTPIRMIDKYAFNGFMKLEDYESNATKYNL